MEHLITVDEVRALGRPISPQIDSEKLQSYIFETERLNIKPAIGDTLFSELLKGVAAKKEGKEVAERITTLLDGGEYNDDGGRYHMFSGLRMAMSYFVYAQYVMDGDFQLTRAGVVVKDGAYSSHVSSKERSDCYNNALLAAQGFLKEAIAYIKFAFREYYSSSNSNAGGPHTSVTVRKIG